MPVKLKNSEPSCCWRHRMPTAGSNLVRVSFQCILWASGGTIQLYATLTWFILFVFHFNQTGQFCIFSYLCISRAWGLNNPALSFSFNYLCTLSIQFCLFIGIFNDPSAGSPTETLLRLLLPLNDQVWSSFRLVTAAARPKTKTTQSETASPKTSLNHSIGSSDGRCVQRAGT